VRAQLKQDKKESMSNTRSDRRKFKELKVLELHDKGFSCRKIAREVHVSLREVTKYIQRISNKRKSPAMSSIHDEIVLEYTVNLLRSEVRDLKKERDNLKIEVRDLRARKSNLEDQVLGQQSETEKLIREKVDAIIHDKELIFSVSFLALTEALRNHPNIKSILFDLIMSQDLSSPVHGKSIVNNLKNDQFMISFYNKLLPLYDEYLCKVMEIIHEELMRSYSLMRAQKDAYLIYPRSNESDFV
jgi:hypothetical protein